MALSDNIKKFREKRNLTQQQLADKLYVSRQTVCRWENGSRCPDLITAKKLALELNVSMDKLISDEDVNDIQMNYGIWKSERVKDKKHLQTLQKKILDSIQIIGVKTMPYRPESLPLRKKSSGLKFLVWKPPFWPVTCPLTGWEMPVTASM